MKPARSWMFHPGQHGFLKVSNALRRGVVLAVLADRALIEYTMPKGTTALAFVNGRFKTEKVSAREGGLIVKFERVNMRPCTYRFLLMPWLQAVIDQSPVDRGWIGNSSRGRVPAARTLMKARFGT